MFQPLFRYLSPPGPTARLSVFIFHRVLAQTDTLFPDEVDAQRFDRLCGWLSAWFRVIPLDAAVAQLKNGTLPERAASITFDDGYADNYHVALPILQRHNLTATFFIATGFLDGGCMWNDTIIESVRACQQPVLDASALNLGVHPLASLAEKTRAIHRLIQDIKYLPTQERVAITQRLASIANVTVPRDLMMTSQEVKAMRIAGMQIGAHTVSHPILARLSEDEARQEMGASKQFLEHLLGERVGLFAYPNGKPGEDYTPQNALMVRELGFDAAVSTQWGASSMGDDLFQIRRFTPWDRSKLRFALRVAQNLAVT